MNSRKYRATVIFFCFSFNLLLAPTVLLATTQKKPCDFFLKDVNELYRESAEVLFDAEQDGGTVAIERGGVPGRIIGTVSNLRVVAGELQFDIDGKPYKNFHHGCSVDRIGVDSSRESILNKIRNNREAVALLLDAQDTRSYVRIEQDGVGGYVRGVISNIRLYEDNELHFEVNGSPYRVVHNIHVSVFSTIRDPEAIIEAVAEHDRCNAHTLLQAQAQGSAVTIRQRGVGGVTKGKVDHVRLENGELCFDIAGKAYYPIYSFEVD